MEWVRLIKISLVATTALFLLITVFNNVTDYPSNYAFVSNVLSMSDTFPGNRLMYRALTASWIHHTFYVLIILWELVAGVLCAWGSWQLVRHLKAKAAVFQRQKREALLGLGLSLQLWFLAFMTVGGQWFAMWQSERWNGQDAATRLFLIMAVILIFVYLPEQDDAGTDVTND